MAAVIVSYNSAGLLDRAVDALLAGSLKPAIYIVDNASSDHSAAVIREKAAHDAVHARFNDTNKGFSAANNQVLQEIAAEYFLLVNPDCVVEPDAVHALVEALDADPDIGLAGGALSNPDGTLQRTSKRRFPTPWSSLARTLGLHRSGAASGAWSDFDLADDRGGAATQPEEVEAISGAMMFVRGAALARVGCLDEGFFMHCEDLDWCKRFHDHGYKVVYVPGARAVHAKGGSGRDYRVIRHLHRGMARFYRKHYSACYPFWFDLLVYAAIGVRCAVLMAASVFRTPAR